MGQKLLDKGGDVSREVLKAADIWQRGIARDLAEAVGNELAKTYTNNPSADQAQAPADSGGAANANGAGDTGGAGTTGGAGN